MNTTQLELTFPVRINNIQLSAEVLRRFWNKVRFNGPIPRHRPELGQCWIWNRGQSGITHRQISIDGRLIGAHRVAYAIAYGVDPGDLFVCHHCDNPPCVRPTHLFCGPAAANSADMVSKGRVASGERQGVYTQPWTKRTCETHGMHKLTAEEVRLIFTALREGTMSRHQLASRYSVSKRTIQFIDQRKIWRPVTDDLA